MAFEKLCRFCDTLKDMQCFALKGDTKDGRTSKCRSCHKIYNDSRKEQRAIYLRENKEKIARRQKLYDIAHANRRREYRETNKERLNRRNVELERHKLKTDPHFRMIKNLRGLTKKSIKNGFGIKAFKTLELLGTSWEGVKAHIEAKFQSGMTWENHGIHGWHIDHIRPVSSFDLTDPEQQKLAFNYTNLQPLWALDNLKKSDKWEESLVSPQ